MNSVRLFGIVLMFLTCVSKSPAKQPAQQAAAQQAAQGEKLFWIFLTTGKSTTGVATEEIQTMQAAHLGNFRRLAKAGKLLTAGPLNDRKQKLRGIVVVKAATKASVQEMFKADPYVTNGFMNVEAHEVAIRSGRFVTKLTPSEMEELRLVVFAEKEEGNPITGEARDGQAKYAAQLHKEGALLLVSELPSSKGLRSIWIAKPRTDLKNLVDASPAITDMGLDVQIIPLYVGKGAISSQ